MRFSAGSARGDLDAAAGAEAPRSLAGALVSRALISVTGIADRAGRLVLCIGLLVVGLSGLRAFGGALTLADPFLLLSLLCALVAALHRGKVNFAVFKFHSIGIGLVIVGITIAAAYRPSVEWASLINLTKFVFSTTCLFFTASVLLRDATHLRLALSLWVGSACITAGVGLLQAWLGESVIGYEGVAWQRMPGLSGNANHLGVIAGMAVAPALTLAATSRGPAQAGWLVAVVLAASGVVVSASRTGALAAAGSFVLWVFLHYQLRKEFTLFAAGCCLAGTIAIGFLHVEWWGGENIVNRLEQAAGPTPDNAVEWRLAQFDEVIRRSLSNPLIGFGLAGEESGVHVGLVHSMYLRVLHGGGVLAFLGLLIVLADLIHKGLRTYLANARYESRAMAAALTSGIAALLLAGLTEPLLYQRPVWVPAALLFASLTLPRQRARRESRRSSRRAAPTASSARTGSRTDHGGRSWGRDRGVRRGAR